MADVFNAPQANSLSFTTLQSVGPVEDMLDYTPAGDAVVPTGGTSTNTTQSAVVGEVAPGVQGGTGSQANTYISGSPSESELDKLLHRQTADLKPIPATNTSANSNTSQKNSAKFKGTTVSRVAFALTCQKWLSEKTPRYIYCNVNPSQVSWDFPIRAVDQLTLGGRVQHVWRTYQRRSYFDEPKVKFTFQSGNILPVSLDNTGSTSKSNLGVPAGLNNFYSFFELINQPRVFNGSTGSRQVNTMYILYNSRVFPQMTLSGMWNPEGLTFEESADNPHQVTWSSSFTVYDSSPEFGSGTINMINAYRAAGFGKL